VNTHEPWEFVLLALAAFRIWRLLAVDTILDGPRQYVLRLGWRWMDGDPIPTKYRRHWAIFLECPYCLGWWLSLGIYLLWVWLPTETVFVATPFALSAALALIRSNLDPPEE
jgi:hypothetical protein